MKKHLLLLLFLPILFSCKKDKPVLKQTMWMPSGIDVNEKVRSAQTYGNVAILAGERNIYKVNTSEQVTYTSPTMNLYFGYSKKYMCALGGMYEYGVDVLYHEKGGNKIFTKYYADLDSNFSKDIKHGLVMSGTNEWYYINDSLDEVVSIYSHWGMRKLVINVLKIHLKNDTIADVTLKTQHIITMTNMNYEGGNRGVIYANGSYFIALKELGLYEINTNYQLNQVLNTPVIDVYYRNGVLYSPEKDGTMHISANHGNTWSTESVDFWRATGHTMGRLRVLDDNFMCFNDYSKGCVLFKGPSTYSAVANYSNFPGRPGFLFYFNGMYYCASDATTVLQAINNIY